MRKLITRVNKVNANSWGRVRMRKLLVVMTVAMGLLVVAPEAKAQETTFAYVSRPPVYTSGEPALWSQVDSPVRSAVLYPVEFLAAANKFTITMHDAVVLPGRTVLIRISQTLGDAQALTDTCLAEGTPTTFTSLAPGATVKIMIAAFTGVLSVPFVCDERATAGTMVVST